MAPSHKFELKKSVTDWEPTYWSYQEKLNQRIGSINQEIQITKK